jgi:sugar/nucleoside kinase (ribokinase family)
MTEGLLIVKQPLRMVDIVKMNAAELILLTGQKDLRLGLQELDTTAALVVVTQGAQGCLYRFQGTIYEQKVPPATQVIDTTGAGDALMAALLAGLPDAPARLNAEVVASIIKRACQAGTYSVARAGAIPSLPYAHELL